MRHYRLRHQHISHTARASCAVDGHANNSRDIIGSEDNVFGQVPTVPSSHQHWVGRGGKRQGARALETRSATWLSQLDGIWPPQWYYDVRTQAEPSRKQLLSRHGQWHHKHYCHHRKSHDNDNDSSSNNNNSTNHNHNHNHNNMKLLSRHFALIYTYVHVPANLKPLKKPAKRQLGSEQSNQGNAPIASDGGLGQWKPYLSTASAYCGWKQ